MRTATLVTGVLLTLGIGPAHSAESVTREMLFETGRPRMEQTVCIDSVIGLFGGSIEECRKQIPALVSACEAKLTTEIPESFPHSSENMSKYVRAYADCVILGYAELHKDSPEGKRSRRWLNQ